MSSCRVLLIVSSLFALCLPPFAGYYAAIPDDPNGTRHPYGGTWSRSPAPTGFPGSGIFVPNQGDSYGYSTGASSTTDSPSTSATASGTLTKIYHWVPSFSGDTAPKKIIVEEHCTTSATGSSQANERGGNGPGQATAAVSNGLGTPVTTTTDQTSTLLSITKSSNGSRTRVVDGGDTVTLTCATSATASASAPQYGGASSHVAVFWTVMRVTPVVIGLAGTTPDGTTLKILTGQKVRGSITAGDYQFVVGSYDWTVSGAEPFSSATFNTSIGKKYDLTGSDLISSTVEFFTANNGNVTVKCSAKVQTRDGPKDVSAEARPVTSVKPTATWSIRSASPRYDIDPPTGPASGPSYFAPFGLEERGQSPNGQEWSSIVTVVAPFTGGQAGFCQLVVPARYRYEKLNGTQSDLGNFADGTPKCGTEGLDTAFLLYPWGAPGDGLNRNSGAGGDSPQQYTLVGDMSRSTAADSFRTWIMYQPPDNGVGVCFIPLKKYSWNWSAVSQVQSPVATSTWCDLGALLGASPTSSPSNTQEFPEWTRLHTAVTIQP